MTKENLNQFVQKVADSAELQSAIGEGIDAESLIALGAEHGFEFSVEDLRESVELSDEDLDGVVGGLKPGDKYHSQVSLGPLYGVYVPQSYGMPLGSDFHGPNLFAFGGYDLSIEGLVPK